jgi:hypothetical protein
MSMEALPRVNRAESEIACLVLKRFSCEPHHLNLGLNTYLFKIAVLANTSQTYVKLSSYDLIEMLPNHSYEDRLN